MFKFNDSKIPEALNVSTINLKLFEIAQVLFFELINLKFGNFDFNDLKV